MAKEKEFILWFKDLKIEDVPVVGGKNASLGEMYRELTRKGVRIPNGFATTAHAYKYLLRHSGIEKEMRQLLEGLDIKNVKQLAERGKKIRELIRRAEFPEDLKEAIFKAYRQLSKEYRASEVDVAVRSSATAEDLPEASFAGQQETYLNIVGEHALLDACRNCFASLFTNRAIAYRAEKGFDHFRVYLSIGIQKMVRSDLASAGVMFTLDTETGFPHVCFITSSCGLGENVVQGAVNPDEFYVFKPTLKEGYTPIIQRVLGEKSIKMIYATEGTRPTKNIPATPEERRKFSLTDEEVLQLAKWGVIIEDHYSQKKRKWVPMDIEWAKDGQSGKLFIVQARPETVQSQKSRTVLEEYVLKEKGKVIAVGKSIGNKIGQGTAQVIKDVKEISHFRPGDVLVTEMTDPDWVPIMRMAKAIVTNKGGRTCFTGDTRILTNYGFTTMKRIHENHENILVPSLNRKTLKIEWKPVIATMKRRAPVIELNTSLTGRMQGNTLRLTPNHKMLTIENRQLVDREAAALLKNKEMLLVAGKLPAISASTGREQQLAYLLGALSTDGHIYLSDTHGEVQLIQKPTPEKAAFIAEYRRIVKDVLHGKVSESAAAESKGFIRGKPVRGSVTRYRTHDKVLAEELLLEKESFVETLLESDESVAYSYLAGVIDGDGTCHANSSRISIFCGKQNVVEAVITACLRIGVVPQVTTNRNCANIQIAEKVQEILTHTKRVKYSCPRIRQGTRFFAARQILGDVIKDVNFKGRIKPYVEQNFLIDSQKVQTQVVPLADEKIRAEIRKLLESDLRMQRAGFSRELGEQDVYNITVADNHNYIVFTDRFTPVLVNNCHAAIVSRELGIPCVVGTLDGTEKVRGGQKITVSCAEGEEGKVYDGLLKFEIQKLDLKQMPKTRTKVMMNVGNPEEAFELSFIPNQGVGLARMEFIINEYIKIHPMALLKFDKLTDEGVKIKIVELTHGYKSKPYFFIDKLAQGIAMITAAFYPNDVIVRLSDFKTNEYANLIGGAGFEPKEENPMIGWRGASRYYKVGYRDAFALECKAIRKVRDEFGLKNLKVMVPFCRTVEEGKKVVEEMRKNGLERGKNGLQVYVMCEIPSNVVLADEFSKVFDGFSIGSNDLTQLTLGLDRDSAIVADLFDERNEAVKRMVEYVIRQAKAYRRKIGICGDAPSTHADFAQFLVQCGIDSISLSPDAVVKTTLKIAEMEKKLRR